MAAHSTKQAPRARREPGTPLGGRDPIGTLVPHSARRLAALCEAGGGSSVAQSGALCRALAASEAAPQGFVPTAALMEHTAGAFRRERRLAEGEAMAAWCEENDLDAEGFSRFVQGEAALRFVAELFEADGVRHLPDHLRARGTYAALQAHVSRRAPLDERVEEIVEHADLRLLGGRVLRDEARCLRFVDTALDELRRLAVEGEVPTYLSPQMFKGQLFPVALLDLELSDGELETRTRESIRESFERASP